MLFLHTFLYFAFIALCSLLVPVSCLCMFISPCLFFITDSISIFLFCFVYMYLSIVPLPLPAPHLPLLFAFPLSLLPLLFPLPLLSPLLSPSLAPPSSCNFSPSLIGFLIGIIVIVHIAITIDNQSYFLSLSVTKGSFCGDCGQPCIVS